MHVEPAAGVAGARSRGELDRLDWKPGDAVPEGWVVANGNRGRPYVIVGATLGAVGYVGAWGQMLGSDCLRAACAALMLPAVGPFIVAADRQAKPEQQGMAIALGAAQLAGAGLFVVGAVLENKILIRKPPVAIAPALSPGAAGVVVGGAL